MVVVSPFSNYCAQTTVHDVVRRTRDQSWYPSTKPRTEHGQMDMLDGGGKNYQKSQRANRIVPSRAGVC